MATPLGVTITDKDGTQHHYTMEEAVNMGYKVEDLTTGTVKNAYKTAEGSYTPYFSQSIDPAVSIDTTSGKITVTTPDEWQDDDYVKKLTDSSILTTISRNYKADKDVKYQDPYDETKQVTTEEYISQINKGLKERYAALEMTAPSKAELISRYGGSKKKNDVINGMTTEDIIVMFSDTSADDSWIPIPAYMLVAYPELANLATYKNGYVKRNDFFENFYNIEKGNITEGQAEGIVKSTETALNKELETLTPEEVAKIVSFQGVVSNSAPIRSEFQKFARGANAYAHGFYGGLYDWATDTANLLVNVVKLGWWTGGVDVKTPLMENAFMDGAGLSAKSQREMLTALSYTDPNAAAALRAGYSFGEVSGNAIDMVVTMVAFGELGKTITNKIVSKGTSKTSETVFSLLESTEGTSETAEIATRTQAELTRRALRAEAIKTAKTLRGMPATTQMFFSQTLDQAKNTFMVALGGTQAMIDSMSTAQALRLVDAAVKVARNATLAETALGMLSNLVIGAVVGNKKLAAKVLSGGATSSETEQWLSQSIFNAAKLTALSTLSGAGAEAFGRSIKGTKLEADINILRQKVSKAVLKAETGVTGTWLKFRKWFLDKKMLAEQVSNATANSAEALREAVIVNEARRYAASQSTATTSGAFAEFSSMAPVTPDVSTDNAAWASAVVPSISKAATPIESALADVSSTLAKAGIVINAGTNTASPFMGAQAALVELENTLTDWGDISTTEQEMLGELIDPDIEPVISAQISDVSNANAELLRLEASEGLLSKEEFSKNKELAKTDNGLAFAYHSQKASVYAIRSHELQIITDRARAEGTAVENYPGYKEAKARYDKAAADLPVEIRKTIDDRVIPSLRRVEGSIIDRMTKDWKVYPESFVEGLRASGRFGENGEDWLRLVARKDLPQGTYMPFSRVSQRDYTIDLNRDKILEDDDITWIGNGLYELIRESALARMEKRFLTSAKKATGMTPEIVVSGEKTAAARSLKEYKVDLNNAIDNGIRSFVEDMKISTGVKKKRDIVPSASQKEVNTTGGIQMMDGASIRVALNDAGVSTTDSIVDQASLDEFYRGSSEEGKKLLDVFYENGTVLAELDDITSLSAARYNNFLRMRTESPEEFTALMDKIDRANALANDKVKTSGDIEVAAGEYSDLQKELEKDTVANDGLSYIVEEITSKGKANQLKYDIDRETLDADLDYAIDGLVELVEKNKKAELALDGVVGLQGVGNTPVRREFIILDNVLSSDGKRLFKGTIRDLAKAVVDNNIPPKKTIIKGNLDSLYRKVETAIIDKLEARFASDKAQLESAGEKVDSQTITELLDKYHQDIMGAKSETLVIKTTDDKGEIQYERVSPSIADVYNNRPIYTPVSTPMQVLSNLALLKRISTTNLNPRSFAKQAVSDPALAFATTGALPGTLHAMENEIAIRFGARIADEIKSNDPTRYQNIQAIAGREGISVEEATMRNINALSDLRLPFTTINQEALRQANVSKYGNKVALEKQRKTTNQKINDALRKASDKIGRPNDIREEYVRKLAGEKAFLDALGKGYNYDQAESFRRYAQDNATTNFRQKSTVFNNLRSTTPYLTSGISGAKSFWKMFQLDPIGVSARIFTGFVVPIIYFMGEILSDEETKKKYDALAEYEKENHIIVAVDGELIRIPVGEELGGYVNLITHIVEGIHNANKYDFWLLMLNDIVGLYPVVDLTGFTDPEMWQPISGEAPDFLEVMDNGVSKVLSATMPPVAQSLYMAISGRDLYTGKKVNTGYTTIDADGNAVITSYSQSQFAKAIANIIGGDARVIEKVTSGIFGTTALHVLDTVTSAVQYVASEGQEGSLTTGVEKTLEDLANPYTTHGYASLERQWSASVSALYDKKEQIINSDAYKKYNQKISSTRDLEERQKLINKRNELLSGFQESVANLVGGFRNAGGELNKKRFSDAVSLLTFEDAVRADRAFMELNTDYGDAYKQAMATLLSYGITNPEGVSMLGYIYTDSNGNPQVRMWTPAQIQVISDSLYSQGDVHRSQIEAIIDDGTEDSLKNQLKAEKQAEQEYWNKSKMANADYNAIDELRKAYNNKVVKALKNYMNAYGAEYILSNDAVMDYLEDIIRVPSAYETVKGKYVSSGGGKLNKQQGFAESYIKAIFGVK